MKNKKLVLFTFPLLFILFSLTPGKTGSDPHPLIDIESLETEEDFHQAYEVLKDKVKELKVAKKEATSKAEKKMIKEDITHVKNEIEAVKAKALSGGIYIGSGALLLIIILLILL